MDSKYLLAGNKDGMYIVRDGYAMYLDNTNTLCLFCKTDQTDGVYYLDATTERRADDQEAAVLQSILDKPLMLPIKNKDKYTVESYLYGILDATQNTDIHRTLVGPPYLTKMAAEAWEKSGGLISFERDEVYVAYGCMAASDKVIEKLHNPINVNPLKYYYGINFKGDKGCCTFGKHTLVIFKDDLEYVSILCAAKILE